jgi:glycine cleavage system aminomethyltransferase T
MIALASVDAAHSKIGTELQAEVTIEAVRHKTAVKVVQLPFYNPARKTRTPAS